MDSGIRRGAAAPLPLTLGANQGLFVADPTPEVDAVVDAPADATEPSAEPTAIPDSGRVDLLTDLARDMGNRRGGSRHRAADVDALFADATASKASSL